MMTDDATKPPASSPGLDGLAQAAVRVKTRGLPPIHQWNPPDCGDIGLRIGRDGTWFYQDSPIGRPAMVRLFSSILRKDPEGHVLVTPVEKVSVEVEDAPFVAVEMQVEGVGEARRLRLRTHVDDWVSVDAAHPLRFEPGPSGGLKPYLLVRDALWALVARPLFYDLAALGEVREVDGREMFGVASSGAFFPMSPADALEDLA
jgi:hypothetical protein